MKADPDHGYRGCYLLGDYCEGDYGSYSLYGKTWLAYATKPAKEGEG